MDFPKLVEIAIKFREARVLLTGVELNIFTLLSEKEMDLQEICKELHSEERATQYLLDAMSAMKLLEKKEGKYKTSIEVVPFLSKKGPECMLPMLEHYANLWHRWSQLTDIVRGKTITIKPVEQMSSDQLKAFILGMHVLAQRASRPLLKKLGTIPYKKMLDVGGASGTYSEAFIEMNPQLQATIFDLPPVIDIARERLKNSPYKDRIDFYAGDFYKDELPCGYDFLWLSAIIHQNSRKQNVNLYKKCMSALETGGVLWIRDYVMSEDRTHPKTGALFAINMLVGTQGGGTYTFEEIKEDLNQAGFKNVHFKIHGEQMD
ncbi:MAG: methyltransferase, partial [Candidatus Hydrogenedens sp.]